MICLMKKIISRNDPFNCEYEKYLFYVQVLSSRLKGMQSSDQRYAVFQLLDFLRSFFDEFNSTRIAL